MYLELKIQTLNSDVDYSRVNYAFYTGEFGGLGNTEFIRSSVELHFAEFDRSLTVEEANACLLPLLYLEAKAKGYETFQ